MESTRKYRFSVYNVLESDYLVALVHPKYVKDIRSENDKS